MDVWRACAQRVLRPQDCWILLVSTMSIFCCIFLPACSRRHIAHLDCRFNSTPFWYENQFCGFKSQGVTIIFVTKNIFPLTPCYGVIHCVMHHNVWFCLGEGRMMASQKHDPGCRRMDSGEKWSECDTSALITAPPSSPAPAPYFAGQIGRIMGRQQTGTTPPRICTHYLATNDHLATRDNFQCPASNCYM